MITLKQGEKVRKSAEVKKSKHGKGVFYISNLGISLETQKHGIIIDLSYEWLRSFQAVKKDKIMIVWDDEEGKRLSYEMKVDSAEQLVHEITAANEEYSKTLSETDAVKKFENTKTKSASQPTFTIPDHISKDKIWNDCWFDEKRNVYVTHNSHFLNNKNRRFFEVQEQYEKETNDIGVAVPVNKIKFFYGFPSVSLYNDETKSSTIWFFYLRLKMKC